MKKIFSLLLVFLAFTALGQEQILNYNSEIIVNKDRSLSVTETIKVRAEGNMIQRGIFRDIPNVMLDENDLRLKVDLEFEEVLLDGRPVNWAVEGIHDGKRVKIGDADIFLDPGEYTYTIRYRMADQVRFFEGYDEVYWNVTGNQWNFPILEATGTIVLPEGSEFSQHAGYSGGFGDTGCQCESKQEGNRLTYTMTESLSYYEGLTIAAGFPKGIIPPPTEEELRARKVKQYMPLIVLSGGIFIVFLYYLFAWVRVGKDPHKGSIFARFEPPEGYSPAATRYVLKMGFDNKAFAASIVSMAVKGFLKIDKTGRKYELIKQTEDESMLTSGEAKVAQKLFKYSSSITIKQSNHSTISSAINALKAELKKDFRKINFKKNKGWLAPGIILSIITFIVTMVYLSDYAEKLMSLIIILFASMFVIPMIIVLVKAIKSIIGGNIFTGIASALVPGIFLVGGSYTLGTFIMEGVIEWHYIEGILPYVLLMITLIGVNILFDYLIQAPTVMGRKTMDEIEGLKMYMEVAEKHRLERMNPPKETPELFEALLPFAIALSVENAWAGRFSSIIESAIARGDYKPNWYAGTHSFNNLGRMSSDLGSNFSSSISSASVSPQSSSSSGSSGGGSSGGGGGGGGGGGW